MIETRVVDTNVLIVASAADDGSPFRPDATPVEEAKLRQAVLSWLIAFEQDHQQHVVLDWDWIICDEYRHKLTDQDYGLSVIMAKYDRNETFCFKLDVDRDGHAHLPPEIATAVTDLADRKMVAAVIASQQQEHNCRLVNACDTDWLDCEEILSANNILVEHLIEDWLRNKWQAMHS